MSEKAGAAVLHPRPVCTRAIRRFSHIEALPSLLLVVAPTGYGKTVLVNAIAEALRAKGCPVLIHALDEGRPEVGTAMSNIERLLGCVDTDATMMFYGGALLEADLRIDNILRAAADLDRDMVLLLDGFDARRDTELGSLIERLAMARLPHLRIVLTATGLPAETLHRARLQGGTGVLGPADLSMGDDEIRELFENAPGNGVALTAAQLDIVKARTEGWPAAVRLMHVAMSSRIDPQALGFGEGFGEGFETSLTDTLSREVLAAIDPAIARLLFEIADLECFNAELCAHMTGDVSASRVVAELVRLNLLIFPATGRPGWYRLHNLFRDFLQRELHASRSEQARHALLARALDWCRAHGCLHDAFELALTLRDGAQAGELLAARAQQLVRDRGELYFYIAAYERLLAIASAPAEEAQHWYVWALIFGRQYEKAYRVVAAMPAGEDPVAERSLRKEALLSIILFSLDRVAEARLQGERWLQADAGLNPFETAGVACVIGTAGVADLDFVAARRGFWLARNAMSRTGSEYGMGWVSCLEAMVDIEEGDVPLDATVLKDAIQRARQALSPIAPIISTMEIMAAKIALELGELEEARERVLHGLSQARQHGFIETTKIALEVAVRLWDGRWDSVFAPQPLDAVATHFPPRLLLVHNCAVLVRLVRLGLHQQALDWAHRRGLEILLAPGAANTAAPELASLRRALLDARVAWHIAQRDPAAALALVDAELPLALKSSCAAWKVHLLLTRLSLLVATGQAAQAGKVLLRAIGIAAPRHLKQPFMEYGDVIRPLMLASTPKQLPLVTDAEFRFLGEIRHGLGAGESRPEDGEDARAGSFDVERPTNREIELLRYLDGGLSNQDIADRLGLTVGTVKWHLHNLYTKLRVSNRSAALFKAKRSGLLER